jgi:hypothetical protein
MIHKCVRDRFPTFKLFYEKNTHKKVNTDYYLAVPYGKKFFAWFTHHNNENVCVFIEIKVGKNGIFTIVSSSIRPVAFHSSLSLGTILYGSIIPKSNFFCVENIYSYKGEHLTNKNNNERLSLLRDIFKDNIRQVNLINSEMIFGMALISNSFKWLIKEVATLPYKIYSIQCKNFSNNNAFKMMYKLFEREEISKEVGVFEIMALVGVDNYQLIDCKTQEHLGMAYVPNFQTSKLMNSIFRTIKENDNLDALEESDDEDEFENTNDDKYVDLKKKVKMECKMHPTFKKWVPVKLLS